MSDIEMLKRWKITETHLETARALLPAPSAEASVVFEHSLTEYLKFIDHNELELALNVLQEMGDIVPCRGGYWRALEKAAESMELVYRKEYFRTRFLQTKADGN